MFILRTCESTETWPSEGLVDLTCPSKGLVDLIWPSLGLVDVRCPSGIRKWPAGLYSCGSAVTY